MKKSLSLFGLLFAAAAAFAQPFSLTLQVDMKNEDPATLANGVSAAGSFQSEIVGGGQTNWSPGALMLTETPAGSKKYSVTVQIATAGTYAFKFVKGTSWGNNEGIAGTCAAAGSDNRELVIAGNTVYPLNCYNACAACPTTIDTLNVRMLVDLTNKIILDGAPASVSVAGNFQAAVVDGGFSNWTPGQIHLTPVIAGSSIYQTPIMRIPAGNYAYKFVYGDAWGADENFSGPCTSGGNRSMALTGANNSNLNVGPFCFAYCDASCPTLYPPRPVKFVVDVSNTAGGTFAVDGTMQNPAFTGTHIAMTDDMNGMTWSKTIDIRPGDFQYRYYNVAGANTTEENFMTATSVCADAIQGPVGDTRRTLTVPVGTGVYEVKVGGITPFFNECYVATASQKQSAAFFTTAPNPFSTATRITFSNLENARFSINITDVTGRTVKTMTNLAGNTADITREGLTSGVFFATLVTENGARFTQKLIVE